MSDPFEDLELRAIRLQQRTTNPDLPSALPLKPEHTLVGAGGPPAWQSAEGAPGSLPHRIEPKRSLSPPPQELARDPQSAREVRTRARKLAEEQDARDDVTVHQKGLLVRWEWIKKAAPWVLVVVATGGGGTAGYFGAWRAAARERADLVATVAQHEKELAEREVAEQATQKLIRSFSDSLKVEAASNRAERATCRDALIDKGCKLIVVVPELPEGAVK